MTFIFAAGACGRRLWVASALVAGAVLSACGGGSSTASSGSAPTVLPPTLTISATPASIEAGQSSTLTWSASADATNCSASGAWTGSQPTSGSLVVSQTTPGSYSYTLTCAGPGGVTANSATLSVSAGAPMISVLMDPSTVSTDHSATLSWSATNATSCGASGAWSGSRYVNGSTTVSQPSAGSYVYTLSCSNGAASASKSVTLTVVNPGGLTTTLSASPSSVAVGQTSTLTWSSSGADRCVATGEWSGDLAASGSRSVTVSNQGDNYYGIQCSSATANGYASTIIQGVQATASLSANPTTVGAGQPATLTWTSTQAQSCTASGDWSGTLASSGSQSVTPSTVGSHVYTISCGNPGAPAQASVMVSATVPTTTLSVFPAAVKVGQDFALTWDSPHAQSCTASQGWSGSVANSGQKTMTATQAGTFQYALMCTNAGGSDNRSVSLTVAAAPAQPPATAFQITPNHAGVTTFSGTLSFPATPTWSVTLPGAVSYPLIADGKVFVTVANQGSYGTKLYALDQATGSTLWGPVAIDGTYFWSNATYENGTVFVVQFDGTLSSFNAATGAPGWSTNLSGQYAFSAPPTAYGGLVFVGGVGTVYAVDQSNGAVKWSASVAYGDKSSPTLTPTGLFVTYPCQAYDFAPDTGAEVWHKSNGCSGGGGRTSPAANAVLYARYFDIYTGDSIYEFDSSTGDQLGQLSSETVPAVTSKQLFKMSSGTLQAVNLSAGSVQWSFAGDGGLVTAPIVINNRVIVGSSTGKIYAVDAATGVSIWSSAAAAGMNATDEQNVSAPTSGLAAGEGYLIAPAGSKLSAWKIVP